MTPNKNLLDINLNRLEQECQNHSRLMWEWARELVIARKTVKNIKNGLKLRAGQLDQECRVDPEGTLALDKVTEKAVEYYIHRDERYQKLQQELTEAEAGEDYLGFFVKALNDRKDALSDLVRLHGQTYWSKPDTSGVNMDDNLRLSRQANETLNKPKKKKVRE